MKQRQVPIAPWDEITDKRLNDMSELGMRADNDPYGGDAARISIGNFRASIPGVPGVRTILVRMVQDVVSPTFQQVAALPDDEGYANAVAQIWDLATNKFIDDGGSYARVKPCFGLQLKTI